MSSILPPVMGRSLLMRITGKTVGDLLAVMAVAVAGLLYFGPVVPRHARTIFVSPAGSDWRMGATAAHPARTIQRAADIARPGDTVMMLPGTYREVVHLRRSGTADEPITFRAQLPGTVVLTGAAEPSVARDLAWKDEGSGVFSTVPPWIIYHVRGDGMTLFRCYGLKGLRELTSRPGAFGAFTFENGRLYLRFADGRTPASHLVELHRPIRPPAETWTWKATNVFVDADHLRLVGLRFDFGVGSSVYLWNAEDIQIVDCLFTGAVIGVNAAAGIKPVVGLRLEHSLYHNYPEGEWGRTWLTWADVYASYSQSTLIRSMNDGTVISHNLVVHGGDGMEVSTLDVDVKQGVDVSDNLIADCTDDAIDMVGFSRGIRFEHNLVYNCHESLGSRVLAGPVTVRRNLFLHPASGLNGAQVKLINDRRTIRNVEISDNTFVGNWLSWTDGSPIEHVFVHDNVFAVQRQVQPPWPFGVEEAHNSYIRLPESGYPNPGRDARWWSGRAAEVNVGGGSHGRATAAPGASVRWTMPRPGPRWLDWDSLPATDHLRMQLAPDLFSR